MSMISTLLVSPGLLLYSKDAFSCSGLRGVSTKGSLVLVSSNCLRTKGLEEEFLKGFRPFLDTVGLKGLFSLRPNDELLRPAPSNEFRLA